MGHNMQPYPNAPSGLVSRHHSRHKVVSIRLRSYRSCKQQAHTDNRLSFFTGRFQTLPVLIGDPLTPIASYPTNYHQTYGGHPAQYPPSFNFFCKDVSTYDAETPVAFSCSSSFSRLSMDSPDRSGAPKCSASHK